MISMSSREFTKSLEKIGWTQKKLGEYLGIHTQSIWAYKTGRQPIPVAVARCVKQLVKDKDNEEN